MKIKVDNINIESILTSGACFRAIKEEDGSFTNILKDRVINIKQEKDILIVKSSKNDNLKEVIYEYFDLNRDYNKINKELINKYPNIKEIIYNCKDYRILNQDSFEMCISYIISQNNNVKRITNSINNICKDYGKKVTYNNKEYYLFPEYEVLNKLSTEELKKYGVGFRDKYIRDFLDKYETLKELDKLSTKEALEKLYSIKGIGLKVASCILLFGYKRLDVFPIDTWVKHYMEEHYNINTNQKEIEKFSKENFGEYTGLVIQYMFHTQRNN